MSAKLPRLLLYPPAPESNISGAVPIHRTVPPRRLLARIAVPTFGRPRWRSRQYLSREARNWWPYSIQGATDELDDRPHRRGPPKHRLRMLRTERELVDRIRL